MYALFCCFGFSFLLDDSDAANRRRRTRCFLRCTSAMVYECPAGANIIAGFFFSSLMQTPLFVELAKKDPLCSFRSNYCMLRVQGPKQDASSQCSGSRNDDVFASSMSNCRLLSLDRMRQDLVFFFSSRSWLRTLWVLAVWPSATNAVQMVVDALDGVWRPCGKSSPRT